MSALTPPITQNNNKLIRPAVIELRFSNKPQYVRTVNSYRNALGITKPFNPPSNPTPYTHSDSSFSCQVGLVPRGWKDPGIALRFVLVAQKKIGKNRTIIYWEVKKPNLPTIIDSFRGLGYTVADPLHSTVVPPNADSAQTILRLDDSGTNSLDFTSSQRALLPAADGNTLGFVINPPYPRYAEDQIEPGAPAAPSGFNLLPLGLALLIGLVLGWVLTRVFRQSRS